MDTAEKVTSPWPPESYAYLLQADATFGERLAAVQNIASLDRDLVVLDRYYTAGEEGKWRPQEIRAMKAGGRRKIICYFSIGEAETYRDYWQPEWDADRDGKPDPEAPEFLGRENPHWKGNYKVKYWHPKWQELVLKQLREIMQQGFDGIWLDIVDAFEYYEQEGDKFMDHKVNPETGQTYRQDMIDFIIHIAETGRRLNPEMKLIPQNGSQLLENKIYRQTIAALALEDLFTIGDKLQPREHHEYILSFVSQLKKLGKPVFSTEYAAGKEARTAACRGSIKNGLILLITKRDLTILGQSPAASACK